MYTGHLYLYPYPPAHPLTPTHSITPIDLDHTDTNMSAASGIKVSPDVTQAWTAALKDAGGVRALVLRIEGGEFRCAPVSPFYLPCHISDLFNTDNNRH